MQFYKKWVNMNVNESNNKSFDLKNKKNSNNRKIKEVKCCSIF